MKTESEDAATKFLCECQPALENLLERCLVAGGRGYSAALLDALVPRLGWQKLVALANWAGQCQYAAGKSANVALLEWSEYSGARLDSHLRWESPVVARNTQGGSPMVTPQSVSAAHWRCEVNRQQRVQGEVTGYTPGPWTIGTRHPGRVIAQKRVIAYCTPHPDDTDSPTQEEAANARLIAASPDLLAALQRLLRANEADFERCPSLDVATAFETNSQAIAHARAAIDKAKGGAK